MSKIFTAEQIKITDLLEEESMKNCRLELSMNENCDIIFEINDGINIF